RAAPQDSQGDQAMTSHLKHHSAHPVAMETLPTLGVGRYFLADGSPCTLPFSRAEFDRAQRAVQQCLGTFHFRTGDQVLVLSLFDECCHFGPIEHALNPFGRVLLSADASFYDAGRTESCLRRFAVTAVIGIDGEVLNGLEANGHDVGQLLGDKVVWARPDAYLRLVELQGFQLRRWFELGPAMAMECVAAAGAHVDRL